MVATISAITSGSSRVAYFEKEGYYAKGDPEHKQASRWHGLGAVELGLASLNPSGDYRARSVSPEHFGTILDGQVRGTDITLGRIRDGVRDHRPGFDVTLSAPKSVSIERIFEPKLIDKCHDKAVARTLNYIERALIQTRIYDPISKRRDRVSSPSMVAATFRHETNRNMDTQLHTHCVIANMTHGTDDKWRSIEPTALRQNIKLIGAFYRNELAAELLNNGYELTPSKIGSVPSFEIAGYVRSDIEAFSSRRADILAYIAERGWEYNARNAQKAALETRVAKKEPDRVALYADWRKQAADLGLKSQRLSPEQRPEQRPEKLMSKAAPVSVLEQTCQSIAHLEERQSVFPARELLADVMGRQAGLYRLDEITGAVAQLAKDKHLVPAKLTHAAEAFVTKTALRAERGIIAEMQRGKGAATPFYKEADAKSLDAKTLALNTESNRWPARCA